MNETFGVGDLKETTTILEYVWGGQVVASKDDKALCKVEKYSNLSNYFIKASTMGSQKGNLYNPNGVNDKGLNAVDVSSRRGYYEYVKVDKDTFDLYMSFIKTGNVAYYNQANRRM